MGWKQKVEWHKAELTPNDAKRQAKRDAYDRKHRTCSCGGHPLPECKGR